MFACFIPVQSAKAGTEVACFAGDCLSVGWEMVTEQAFGFALCISGDCRYVGWEEFRSDGTVYEFRCLPGGCFVEGYEVTNSSAGKAKIGEVSCMANDCHRIGWIEKPENEKFVYVTLCKNQDCGQRGWTTRWRNLITTDSTCKVGGCFVNGWREQ